MTKTTLHYIRYAKVFVMDIFCKSFFSFIIVTSDSIKSFPVITFVLCRWGRLFACLSFPSLKLENSDHLPGYMVYLTTAPSPGKHILRKCIHFLYSCCSKYSLLISYVLNFSSRLFREEDTSLPH